MKRSILGVEQRGIAGRSRFTERRERTALLHKIVTQNIECLRRCIHDGRKMPGFVVAFAVSLI